MSGYIVVGSGDWASSGVMAMTRDGLCFGVRRGRVATAFPTKESAEAAIRAVQSDRFADGYAAIDMKIVRLYPVPVYKKARPKGKHGD